MKIRLPTLLLTLILLTTPAHAQITRDKYTHAGVCYAIEYTLKDCKPFSRWKPWQRALSTTAVIGGGKEWYDARRLNNHSADWGAFGVEGGV